MHGLSRRILKHKWIVITTFLIVAVLSIFLSGGVKINYQLMDYLPEDSPSTVGLNIMLDTFDKATPNLRVLVKNVTVPQALGIKERIAQVEGVKEITWLDDVVSIDEPLETMDQKMLESWYKEDSAVFSVLIDSSEESHATLSAIRTIIGDTGAMSGDAVNINSARETTGSEISTIMLFIIPLILIILLITTSSWFEPVLFLLSIAVAIFINNGTNIAFGSVSFITMATSSVLQLAVSMDYSIFLLHRFAEFREKGMEVKEAMALAMEKSFSSILASGLTTILGFAALMFMRFKLGPDMGIVLAKGIVFSLLSVMFLLPVLTVLTYKIIDKTHHRSFLPSFKGFGKLVSKLCVPMVILVALLIGPAFMAQSQNTFLYGAAAMSSDKNSKAYKEESEINDLFGKSNQMVILVSSEDLPREKQLIDDLYRISSVTSVVSYTQSVGGEIPQEFLPEDMLGDLVSGGYSRIILTVNTSQESEAAFRAVEDIRGVAQTHYGDSYYLTGGSVNVYDMKQTVTVDNQLVAIAGIIGIGLVVLLTFRSLSIPIILLMTIEAAIWINLSVPYFSGVSMAYIGFMIISSVQLGATVDYAILYANRYIENRREMEKKKAIVKTVSDTTASILTSAGILTAAGFILGAISTNGVIVEFGILIGRGAILSATSVLLFLPGMLYLFDTALPKTTIGLQFFKPEKRENHES